MIDTLRWNRAGARQGIVSVVAPPKAKLIEPPHAQTHWDELFNAGLLVINTVGDPGAHGAGITGMQGIGVSTPSAAAVAAATVGLANDWHIPNGGMFTMGMLSMMVAAGLFSIVTMPTGKTLNVLGAMPNVHIMVAVLTTGSPMGASYLVALVD